MQELQGLVRLASWFETLWGSLFILAEFRHLRSNVMPSILSLLQTLAKVGPIVNLGYASYQGIHFFGQEIDCLGERLRMRGLTISLEYDMPRHRRGTYVSRLLNLLSNRKISFKLISVRTDVRKQITPTLTQPTIEEVRIVFS
jgi:hypothetical protein